ncbi:HMG box transcription factor [Ophiocordyceps sinensis CO18]|uniref:HMG box transcription factor n=1 Tax=Ophiocordyceps sinensis (strain Co18 / CGMCC 3.14243) TaxID=911162 RepID=T5AAN0_OPHSC|nr:HMG box transcription factor [Ophiocordyceps sinensis CO18]
MFESPPRNSAPGSHLQDGSRDIICLCTPAPKIPRPRNAFILYRQHHQAQVTADNPKLSNPDISKIIGEKWKNEGDEIKKNWKKLAEEEKQRHQNQYPNYRYQPRRGNKSQSAWANTSPTEDQGRCQKCNGRAMNTPQTPSTPYSTSPAGKMGTPSQGPPSLQRLDTALSRRSSFEHSPTSVLPFASKLPSFRDVDSSDPILPTSLAMTPTRDNAIGRGGTLRDMIMSISFKRKIAVLASICQPAPPLLNEANFDGIRGAFIAVEGPDAMLRQGAGIAIEKGLVACGEILLKVWRDDADGHESTGWDEGNALPLGRRGGSKFGDYFEPYLKSISAWQKKSRQIGRHITGTRTLLSSAEEQRADGERVAAQAQSTEACTPPDDDLEQAAATKMPVALANEGFSLTISDRHACALPIPDTYSVVDHWQWMATLWRGTVCPDLIVYVMPSDEEENNERRTVELSRRMGLIVVKVPAGKGLDEATERRLAFEVMEWMREASFREPLPRDWRSELV